MAIDFSNVGDSIGHRDPDEAFQDRYDRIRRKWAKLGKLARRWCGDGMGHRMGPLHKHSSYDRMEHTRVTICKACHMRAWVNLNGTMSGVPSYETCAVMIERKRRYGG
jgi:hypothetical protein